ncbi:MAG: PEP-CTERM sorting domain-containing protein [Victivallales bacterium]|nr:PEP-CTERM sorting domain-containing protein [Victivallales bacterium]
MKIFVYLSISAAVLAAVPSAHALQINGYDSGRHDRFISGYSGDPVANPDFFAAGYDWSGVGWDAANDSRSIALVSPLHFVCAHHYEIPTGNTVTFLNRDGELKSYTIAGYSNFSFTDSDGAHVSDLSLGRLSVAVAEADNIAYYPVLNADNESTPAFEGDWYAGKEIISYGWTARAGTNAIDSLGFVSTNSTQDPDNLTFSAVSDFHSGSSLYPDEAGLEGGDSGSPSFMVWNDQLTLMGTHFAVGSGTTLSYNVDAFLPYYIDNENSAMSGSGYALATINVVPEPSSLLYFVLGMFGMFGLNGSRRKRKSAAEN